MSLLTVLLILLGGYFIYTSTDWRSIIDTTPRWSDEYEGVRYDYDSSLYVIEDLEMLHITGDATNSDFISVFGQDKLIQGLDIQETSSRDVVLVTANNPPIAYGGQHPNAPEAVNACLSDTGGIFDIGWPANGYHYSSREHNYLFTFTPGRTVSEFSLTVLDWGDFLPYGTSSNGTYSMFMGAYNGNGEQVDTDILSFTTSNSGTSRDSNEFGPLSVAGDACAAEKDVEPGNYTFRVSGQGISRVIVGFVNKESTDPYIAIDVESIHFTFED